MVSRRFDPFNSRLSRDIRNSLSEAFVDALEKYDPSVFRRTAKGWLARDLSPVHHQYVRERLNRYERTNAEIQKCGYHDGLSQSLVIWNDGLFFEVHERLEAIWQGASGEQRQALKGLIKAAAVYVHIEQGNQKAARSLSKKAVVLLSQYGKFLPPYIKLNNLIKKLEKVDIIPPKFPTTCRCVDLRVSE